MLTPLKLDKLKTFPKLQFWESSLGFRGKNRLLAAFPKVIPKTNRVLRIAHYTMFGK
jgi:hypothetical protein